MAHYSKIENGVVVEVLVVPEKHANDGNSFLNSIGLSGDWVRTFYEASKNHTPSLRYNYAGVGSFYDANAEAFYSPPPYASWSLNENFQWEPPVPRPENAFYWDEDAQEWVTWTP